MEVGVAIEVGVTDGEALNDSDADGVTVALAVSDPVPVDVAVDDAVPEGDPVVEGVRVAVGLPDADKVTVAADDPDTEDDTVDAGLPETEAVAVDAGEGEADMAATWNKRDRRTSVHRGWPLGLLGEWVLLGDVAPGWQLAALRDVERLMSGCNAVRARITRPFQHGVHMCMVGGCGCAVARPRAVRNTNRLCLTTCPANDKQI